MANLVEINSVQRYSVVRVYPINDLTLHRTLDKRQFRPRNKIVVAVRRITGETKVTVADEVGIGHVNVSGVCGTG